MSRSFLTLLLLLFVQQLLGQKRILIHSITGFNFPAAKNLNNELEAANLLKVGSVYFSRGAGIQTGFGRSRLSLMTYFNTYSGTKESESKSSSVRGTQIGTNLGIAISKNPSLQITPFGGLGYSVFGVRSASSAPADNTAFPGYLGGASNQHHISTSQWVGNIGFQLAKEGLGSSNFGQKLVLGLRTGYFIPLGDSKWKTNETNLSAGPNINAGGFYTSIIFGLLQ